MVVYYVTRLIMLLVISNQIQDVLFMACFKKKL